MVDPVTIGFVFAIIGLIASMVWIGIALFGITKLDEITDSIVETGQSSSDDTALDQLRERYARGELSDEEFEQKVERLVETERLPPEDSPPGEREVSSAENHETATEFDIESEQ